MRYFTFVELRPLLDPSNIDVDLLAERFKIANGGRNHLFTNIDDLKADANKFAIDKGWDPETTLVLYDPPRTEEERAEAAAATAKAIAEDPDWDDIQIGEVDPKQVVASLYRNMTSTQLMDILNGVAR